LKVVDAPGVGFLACDGAHIKQLGTADVEFPMDADEKVLAALRELASLVDEVTDSKQWVH
jgi:hypothetical protein